MAKRHSTPEELDHFFERDIITEDEYSEFWPRWWNADEDGRQEIIHELLEKSEGEVWGPITRDIKEAETEADLIDGYVIRRNSKGQFSKTGTYYQAVPRRKNK